MPDPGGVWNRALSASMRECSAWLAWEEAWVAVYASTAAHALRVHVEAACAKPCVQTHIDRQRRSGTKAYQKTPTEKKYSNDFGSPYRAVLGQVDCLVSIADHGVDSIRILVTKVHKGLSHRTKFSQRMSNNGIDTERGNDYNVRQVNSPCMPTGAS